jgi:hypothetical protein
MILVLGGGAFANVGCIYVFTWLVEDRIRCIIILLLHQGSYPNAKRIIRLLPLYHPFECHYVPPMKSLYVVSFRRRFPL